MDTKLTTLISIIGIMALPALSIYAWQTTTIYTESTASKVAYEFLENSPTYSWDGIEGSIQVFNVTKTRSTKPEWEITLEFSSANTGYGDRTGQQVTNIITDHIIKVTVEGDSITSAVIDQIWDEIAETEVSSGDTSYSEAEEIAIQFLINGPTFSFDGIEGTIDVVDIIAMESYPVQYVITIAFQCSHAGYGDRSGKMLAQVITPHKIRIELSAGEIGSAIIDDKWDELIQRPVNVVLIISPDTAKDIAIKHVKQQYHKLDDVSIPREWAVANLTPEGLLGFTKLEFTGDGWRIEVSYPVVKEPIYNIIIDYDHNIGFNWIGKIDHEGNVLES